MKGISVQKAKLATALIAGLLLMFSCGNDELCEDARSNPLRMGFYLPEVSQGKPSPFIVDSLSLYGVSRSDSLIYNNTKKARSVEVPLNPATNITGFVFIFPGNIHDTLWVEYLHSLNFISAECGFSMFFDLLEITHTNYRISTVQIHQNLVSNSLEEHIKILLYPDVDL